MNYSFQIDAKKTWNGPLYNSRGHRFYFLIKIAVFSLNIIFILANSVDPDEMPHYAAFKAA